MWGNEKRHSFLFTNGAHEFDLIYSSSSSTSYFSDSSKVIVHPTVNLGGFARISNAKPNDCHKAEIEINILEIPPTSSSQAIVLSEQQNKRYIVTKFGGIQVLGFTDLKPFDPMQIIFVALNKKESANWQVERRCSVPVYFGENSTFRIEEMRFNLECWIDENVKTDLAKKFFPLFGPTVKIKFRGSVSKSIDTNTTGEFIWEGESHLGREYKTAVGGCSTFTSHYISGDCKTTVIANMEAIFRSGRDDNINVWGIDDTRLKDFRSFVEKKEQLDWEEWMLNGGGAASVSSESAAWFFKKRALKLLEAEKFGEARGAANRAISCMISYAAGSTSGGEGTARSAELNAFIKELEQTFEDKNIKL